MEAETDRDALQRELRIRATWALMDKKNTVDPVVLPLPSDVLDVAKAFVDARLPDTASAYSEWVEEHLGRGEVREAWDRIFRVMDAISAAPDDSGCIDLLHACKDYMRVFVRGKTIRQLCYAWRNDPFADRIKLIHLRALNPWIWEPRYDHRGVRWP